MFITGNYAPGPSLSTLNLTGPLSDFELAMDNMLDEGSNLLTQNLAVYHWFDLTIAVKMLGM